MTERITTLRLGNAAPLMADGSPAEHLNQTITTVTLAPYYDDAEQAELALSTDNDRTLALIGRGLSKADRRYALGLRDLEDLWGRHSGGAPDWVDSDDEDFARAVAKHFGCQVGEPTMLLTNGGRDALHSQHLNTAAQPAAFNYMAVSANATAPSASSTTLPGEITTAGGGLLRAQATYAHTGGTNTTTLTKTFTANGSDALPVTIAKIGVLNASSAGTLGYETLLSATATLTISGDNVAITHTITAG